MIREIARITVRPDLVEDFVKGVNAAQPLFQRAHGCRGMALEQVLECPSTYLLLVDWENLEDHTVRFRESADFQEWRHLVSHCFDAPPQVEHTKNLLHLF